MKYWALILFFVFKGILVAEIESVTITWTAMECIGTCHQNLADSLRRIYGVAELNFNGAAGQAVMRWRPTTPFSYPAINQTMQMIGLGINQFRIKLKGMISHDRDNFAITSLGDNSRFYLLGPIVPDPNRQVISHSIYTHPLSPSMKDRLFDAEIEQRMVTIEGPLFEPDRSPPYYIVIEHLTVEKSDVNNEAHRLTAPPRKR